MGDIAPNLLFVDCDERVREALQQVCSKSGWSFDLAAGGSAALPSPSRKTYDVVVADVAFPGGLELLRALKRHNPNQAIIVVTDTCSVNDAVSIMKEGASDFIQKPADLVLLERALNKVISQKGNDSQECELERKVSEESISYELTSAELASSTLKLKLAEKLQRLGRITSNTALQLKLAFQEALTNSLDHGNLELDSAWKEEFDNNSIDKYSLKKRERLLDPAFGGRKLYILTAYDHEKFTIRIKDQGKGFDFHNSVLRRDHQIGQLPSYGRGLAMIFVSMDDVVFSFNGTEIQLVKYFKDK
jgi:DNA-binding response OmpR family regulator